MQKHQWRETTDEGTLIFRATYHAGRWEFASAGKGRESVFEDGVEPTQEQWQHLRELLWAKYQRKRCAWKIVESVDKVLKDTYGVIPPQERV